MDRRICGLCGWRDLKMILNLGEQPLSERFDATIVYPLALLECPRCGLVQLSCDVDPELVFPEGHPYATGNSSALRDHYAGLARTIALLATDVPGMLFVDIGANDGTLLSEVAVRAGTKVQCVGVEPTGQARKIVQAGFPVFRDFFTMETARKITRTHGKARVITACNVLAHVPDPAGFADGVAAMLHPHGEFITENHDVASVLRGQWDTVYHEHRWYWSVETLSRLLGQSGLETVAVEPVRTHGGSFRLTARLKPCADHLQVKTDTAARLLSGMLGKLHEAGHAIYGIGATTRAVPLVTFAHIAPFLSVICEVAGNEKIGGKLPGTEIPVVDEAALFADQPPYALILSWHMQHQIIRSLRGKGYQGKFIVPLPEPRVLNV